MPANHQANPQTSANFRRQLNNSSKRHASRRDTKALQFINAILAAIGDDRAGLDEPLAAWINDPIADARHALERGKGADM